MKQSNIYLLIIFTQVNIFANFEIDFFDSMSVSGDKKIIQMKSDKNWLKTKDCYDLFIKNSSLPSQGPIIPKIIHQIWLGGPFPEKYKHLQQTWIKKHPQWEYKLWTEKDIEEFGLQNKEMYDSATNLGQKSDIARYEIIYRIGGLYIDTDFECLKSFDILHYYCDFYTGTAFGPTFSVYNGLFAAAPGHPLLKLCIESIDINKIVSADQSLNILFTSGPYYFTDNFKKYFLSSSNSGKTVAFPVGYFYPWPNSHRDENSPEQIKKWIRPETLAIHHWYVSWNEGKTPGK
jgi:mannosyltransferase OCH1-like enzyme